MMNGAVAETQARWAVELPHGGEMEPIRAGLIHSAGKQALHPII